MLFRLFVILSVLLFFALGASDKAGGNWRGRMKELGN
jgi:hypothetical protein